MDKQIINPYHWLNDWCTNHADEQIALMLFKTIPSVWLDQGMSDVAVYSFHFICHCFQFQGPYSHN